MPPQPLGAAIMAFHLHRKPGRTAALAVALAFPTFAFHSTVAAEKAGLGQAREQPDDESGPASDNSESRAAEKSGGKGGDKAKATPSAQSEGKHADESKDKTGQKTDGKSGKETADESARKDAGKPDDPCKPDKMLVDLELRRQLCQSGLKIGLTDTNEILANLSGGVRQGPIYEGVTDLNLSIDLRPTLGQRGNIFARAYQIRGRGLTANHLDNLNTASGIEASATTRLAELWYEQHFDHWRLRIGEQTITTEFLSPATARLFVNGAFGWPTLPSLDLPSGGPGFPLGTPAIRLRVDPEEGLTLFLASFNGDPTGGGVGGSQLRDPSGTAFRTNDGAFLIGEVRYNEASSDRNGTYRLGGWWNSGQFRDLRLDTSGTSLASPASNGLPQRHGGDFSFYGIVDRPFGFNEADHTSFAAFARAMGAPGDRNLVDLYLDAGLVYKGPFGRADDQVGLALGYARIGSAARAFDADVARFTGQFHPVGSGEGLLELTYQAQLTGWLQLQPDFQYIFNPGGGIANPNFPTRRVGDEAVVGLRATMSF
jgi:porin